MRYDEAEVFYNQIVVTQLTQLREDLIRSAIAYARIRADWQIADFEERREMERSRTAAHNAFIDACNILSRAMARQRENTSWRARLGEDRKEIGNFACYLHCILGLLAR